jgi:general secretion pathway protein B
MSLILEALKKSEAKRRLGEAPDLATPFATPRRRSPALPLLLVAIAAAGAFGWWYVRGRAPAAPVAASAESKDAAAKSTAPTTAARPIPQRSPLAPRPALPAPNADADPTKSAANSAVASASPVPATPAPAPMQRPQAAGNMPRRQAGAVQPAPALPAASFGPHDGAEKLIAARQSGDAAKRGSVFAAGKLPPNMHRVDKADAQTAVKTDVATAAPAAAKTDAPAAAKTDAPAAAKADAPVVAKDSTPAPKPDAAIAAKIEPAAATKPAPDAAQPAVLAKAAKTPDMRGLTPPSEVPAASKNDIPFYYELPFTVRKALPQLRLSMHVYAADAAQRFVILNDSHLAEGEKTSDDVTLREVRPDGAVLEFQGKRFFYPRDGL